MWKQHIGVSLWSAGNSHSMDNKLEELVIYAQLQVYDFVRIMETCWNGLHYWSAAMEGYKTFRKDGLGRQGGRVAIYVRQYLECMELCLWMGDEQAESLRKRTKEQISMSGTVVSVCYRLPDQEGGADEAF